MRFIGIPAVSSTIRACPYTELRYVVHLPLESGHESVDHRRNRT